MKRAVLAVLTALLLFSQAWAQAAEQAVDRFVRAEMERQKIPGVSLAVVRDGKPFIVKGYGYANIELDVPVKAETIFQSGSVGKQFTAFAVMMLVDEGKLALDEKIGKYIDGAPPAWEKVTLRHLLTHTAGFTDYPETFDYRKDYSEADLLKIIKETPLMFAPGERWAYSNLGYVTLGIIIGKVTGKFYGDFLAERVFRPLGMTMTRVISEQDIVPNRAAGYVVAKGEVKNQEWVSPSLNTTADGALYLSVLDMMRWEEALRGRRLLSKTAYDQMWTPVKLAGGKDFPYGFGWSLGSVNGQPLIEHGGSWQGFKAFIARYPQSDLAVIVLANSANADPARLAHRVSALVNAGLDPKPITDTEPGVTAELRRIFEDAIKNKFDDAKLAPRIKARFSDPGDKIVAYLRTLGDLKSFELLERVDSGDAVQHSFAVRFAGGSLMIEIGRNSDGKVVFLRLHPD